jgi:hypothetical protein
MESLYPKARVILFKGSSGGAYLGGPFRGVLHTTQSKSYNPSTTEYYGHSNPPHFTLVRKGSAAVVYQHYSIKVASRALRNPYSGADDVQTNRRSAIQIEIAWLAEEITKFPDFMLVALRELMHWISSEAAIKKIAPPFLGKDAYGSGSASRMSSDEWNAFNGWCGHQHVPENDHWDPGPIDMKFLLA